MSVYVLDLSRAVAEHVATWLPVREVNSSDEAPEEAIFYSLVEGRGELIVFGGVKGDSKNLQRGSSSATLQHVLNSVHFLSFTGSRIHS